MVAENVEGQQHTPLTAEAIISLLQRDDTFEMYSDTSTNTSQSRKSGSPLVSSLRVITVVSKEPIYNLDQFSQNAEETMPAHTPSRLGAKPEAGGYIDNGTYAFPWYSFEETPGNIVVVKFYPDRKLAEINEAYLQTRKFGQEVSAAGRRFGQGDLDYLSIGMHADVIAAWQAGQHLKDLFPVLPVLS